MLYAYDVEMASRPFFIGIAEEYQVTAKRYAAIIFAKLGAWPSKAPRQSGNLFATRNDFSNKRGGCLMTVFTLDIACNFRQILARGRAENELRHYSTPESWLSA